MSPLFVDIAQLALLASAAACWVCGMFSKPWWRHKFFVAAFVLTALAVVSGLAALVVFK